MRSLCNLVSGFAPKVFAAKGRQGKLSETGGVLPTTEEFLCQEEQCTRRG